MSDPLTVDLSSLPEPGTSIREAMTYNAAVMMRLREVALALDADVRLSVESGVLGSALIHRLHELYKRTRKDPAAHELFAATSETLQDLAKAKPPGEMCVLAAGDLLALLGSSPEAT